MRGVGGPILTLNRSWALSPGVWAPWPVALCSSARRCCRAASWAVHVAPAANFRVWLPRFQQQLACNRMRRARHSHAPLPGIFERSPSPLYTAHPNLLNRRLGRPPLGSPRGPAGSPSERHAGCVRIGDFFFAASCCHCCLPACASTVRGPINMMGAAQWEQHDESSTMATK